MRYDAVHVALQQVCKPFKVLIPGFPACTNCLIDEDRHSSLSCCLICLLYHLIIPEFSEPSFRTFEASVPRRQGQSDSDSSFRWPRPPFRNTTATFHASKTRPDQSQVGFHSLSGVAVSRSLSALTCLQGS